MPARTVKMLHIEDEETQRLLMAHQLATLKDFDFTIRYAESEDEAVAAFNQGGFEFVILDYHLTQGNGLSCLKQLRGLDPIVPIVAVSGVATPQIAEELLSAGADDYLSKRDLEANVLTRSVREALARADAWRQRAPTARKDQVRQALALFRTVSETFIHSLTGDFERQLSAMEQAARTAQLTPNQLEQMLTSVCTEIDAKNGNAAGPARLRLRPLVLEVCLRLFGAGSSST